MGIDELKEFGEPRIKVVAMPSNTNVAGNIFGGWILSQIDLAGAIAAKELSPERVVTISMKEVIFKEPVYVGDLVSCYAKITSAGNTSITTDVEVVVERLGKDGKNIFVRVTKACVVYVSVGKDGEKKQIDPRLKKARGF